MFHCVKALYFLERFARIIACRLSESSGFVVQRRKSPSNQLDFYSQHYWFFNCAREVAMLSWFFCVKTKEWRKIKEAYHTEWARHELVTKCVPCHVEWLRNEAVSKHRQGVVVNFSLPLFLDKKWSKNQGAEDFHWNVRFAALLHPNSETALTSFLQKAEAWPQAGVQLNVSLQLHFHWKSSEADIKSLCGKSFHQFQQSSSVQSVDSASDSEVSSRNCDSPES